MKASDLGNKKIKTIVINYKTPFSTLLAILSARRYTDWGIRLVDCSPEENEAFFVSYQKSVPFEYEKRKIDIHGKTLDRIFRESDDDFLLLLDSDAEILNENFIDINYINNDNVFGAGFVQDPGKMSENSMKGWKYLYYQERMFIPCTLLKVDLIKKALNDGMSFEAKKIYNDFHIKWLSHLCYFRFYFKFWQNHQFYPSLPFRKKLTVLSRQ